jgi:hypothetical protein
MKRSHTIKIEDLQNSISEGSIEEISQEQMRKITGGSNPYPLPVSSAKSCMRKYSHDYPLP